MEEYEACAMGLRVAIERKVKVLKVYEDSSLVVYQLRGEWETKDPKLVEYRKLILELVKEFEEITFTFLPREYNQMADVLVILATIFQVNKRANMIPIKMQVYETLAQCYSVEEEDDGHLWYYDILQYIKHQTYSQQASKIDKRTIRRMVVGYVLDGKILYRKGSDQVLIRCVNAREARSILEEVKRDMWNT
ncbi:uncharacterized protein LOC120202059 [Hibiscus syriacus]|uniref:uncharacterized protein LOC120202059 n=1 Tax=Hibiscus syriacus TaxID=106335 RepID=UPI0019236101|nr:uncharacterized protein LOC120202059 [Hibiscus syriacus]